MIIFPNEFKFSSVTDVACIPNGWILEVMPLGKFYSYKKSIIEVFTDYPAKLMQEECSLRKSDHSKLQTSVFLNGNYQTRFFLKDGTLEETEYDLSTQLPENPENYLDYIEPSRKTKCELLNKKLFKDRFILSSLRKCVETNQVVLIGNEEKTITFEIPTDREVMYSTCSADELTILMVTHKEFIIIDNPL